MSVPSRRAGSSLAVLLSSSPCKASSQAACRRAAQQYLHRRPITDNSGQRQEQPTRPQYQRQTQNQAQPAPSATSAASTAQKPTATPAQPQKSTTPSSQPPPQEAHTPQSLTEGLQDAPQTLDSTGETVDWTRSYHGLSATPFTPEAAQILQQEIPFDDVEVKPDGIIYLPEIKYRRILNRAFGPGGWGLAPRGETIVTGSVVTREYSLVCGGRLVSIARGEQQYFSPDGIPTATEGCKSNALMRCCKDLGIASELWDPRYIKRFMREWAKETIVEHVVTKKRRKHFMRKDDEVRYPFKDVGMPQQQQGGFQAKR